MTRYDAVVIGGGMAGLPLALKLGFKGLSVALVERDQLGGTCLNRGCIPTKTLIASARVAHVAREAAHWGVHAGPVEVKLPEVMRRKDDLVNSVRQGAEVNVQKNPNVILIRGQARFTGPQVLDVDGETIEAARVFINTGSRPAMPGIAGLNDVPFLDSTSALHLTELPRHLLVVGGGYIGVEYAQMYRRFGSEVTLVQRGPHLLSEEDEDIARALEQALAQEGITILTGATATAVEDTNGQLRLTVRVDDAEHVLEGSHLLVAGGRQPNTDELNLPAAGVALDTQGFIRINDRLETNVPGIWALGDVRGGPMFTHTARDDARVVYENVTKQAGLSIRDRVVPYAVFSDPQLGRVGLTEREARQLGYRVKVGRYEGRKIAKARALGETAGFIKVVADADTDRLLGAAVLLAEGAEIVHELITAMHLAAKYTDLRDMLHIHPTLAEGLSSALGGVHFEEGI
ncbi:dihydrolipoyl dehydrogenase [Deinococcus soli (ex Cha et al. 2016)]|uniref:dihydrolipoyl dehydrogenase n=1 Tax=Deinococcus soli (ex Cha et al. 2016) TaxID=1309411 RepID=UPI001666188F|nr:dihydrolipoyl dehydrogenase [Deinococcus soli (ex Cha et al. 2016)]GGB84084.1 mercuric reductase [Deinococcus soli (ex Cha et al. 2016)]